MDARSHFQHPGIGRGATILALSAAFGLICVFPYFSRLSHPSLYSDDILRIADLKTTPLSRLLIRPFNEHLAPLFEIVSWTAWKLAGESLVEARRTFTLAAYLPFLLCLCSLGALLRRETRSVTCALVGVAVFSLSFLPAEVVFWYSASSFSWALLFTIMALLWAGSAAEEERHRRRSRLLLALAAFLAPMGSGLGLLAGPLGAIRAGFSRSPSNPRNRLLGVFGSLVGTTAYLGFGWAVRYQATLSASVKQNVDLPIGLWHAARAPALVLIPGLFGISNLEDRISLGMQGLLSAAFWIGAIVWAFRSRSRPLLLAGLGLIFGGYALTYPLRVRKQAVDLLDYQRYHDFPQLGLALLVACALLPVLRRFDAQPVRRLALATAIAAVLIAMHLGPMRSRANLYRFPEQARTFLAIEHLEGICRLESISREQAITALEPIRTKWFPHDFNGLTLLGPTVDAPRCPDSSVRPILLGALTIAEREALFGSMEVAPYIRPATGSPDPISTARMTDRRSVRRDGPPDRFVTLGWPAFLEFDFSDAPDASSARELTFPNCALNGSVEVWWNDGSSPWSSFRSVRWRPRPGSMLGDWSLPLDSIPHFDPARVRRLRVYFREAGPIAFGAPRLVR